MPPSAVSSRPRFCCRGVGKRAALVTEQLALEQLLGKRRAGDVDERTRGPIAVVMDRLGGQVLARPGLPGQQHGRCRALRHPRRAGVLMGCIAGDAPMMASKL